MELRFSIRIPLPRPAEARSQPAHELAQTKIIVAVENTALRLLVVKGSRVVGWTAQPLPQDALQSSESAVAAIGAAVSAALSELSLRDRKGRPKHPIAVSFPGSSALFRTMTLPRLRSRKRVAEALEREARRELAIDPQRVYLFWQPFRSAQQQDFLLVGVQKEAYDRLYAALSASGLRPRLRELKPLALVRAAGKLEAVIVDLEPDNTDIIVVTRGVPQLIRSLPDLFTAAGPREDQVRLLAEHVSRTVDYFSATQTEDGWDPKAPVVLAGELAGDPLVIEGLQAALPYPVEPFASPFRAPEGFPAHAYAALLGVALKQGRSPRSRSATRIDFDVIPPQYQRPPVPVAAVAAAVALVAGVVLIIPVQQAHADKDRDLSDRLNTRSQLQRQVSLAKIQLAKSKEVDKQIDQINARIAALGQERASILSQEAGLSQDVQTVLALAKPGILVDKLSSREGALVFSGGAPDYRSVLSYATSLKDTGRFSSVTVTELAQDEAQPGRVRFSLSVERMQAHKLSDKS